MAKKKWCRHIERGKDDLLRFRHEDPINYKYASIETHFVTEAWHFCPICGKPKPKG